LILTLGIRLYIVIAKLTFEEYLDCSNLFNFFGRSEYIAYLVADDVYTM